jgi:hypothetical protein
MENQSIGPPGRAPSPLWRVLLAVALLTTAGLLLALWPFLRAISGALTTAAVEWDRWIAGALLLFGLGVLAAGLWMLIALALRLTASARQAHLVPLPNGMPAHIRDVSAARRKRGDDGLVAQLLPQSIADHGAQLLAEKQRPFPLLTSYNQHLHNQYAPPQIEATMPPQLPPAFDVQTSVFDQLIARGDIDRSGRSLLVGYAADQAPQYIEMDSCSAIIVGGQPRAGKTSTVKLLLAQAAYMGWHIAVADPHIRKKDGLLNVCQPISGAFIRQAVEPDEIAAMIRWVDRIGQRRLNGDKIDAPVLLVIDEFSNVVLREWVPKDVLALLAAMTMAYAGVQVHMLIIGHDFSAKLLGGALGTSLRRATTHRIVHKIAADAAEMILPSAAWGRQAADLETGRAVYWGEGSPLPITVPWIQGEDLIVAARGRPPKPYAPRQLAATPQRAITSGLPPSPIPPTIPLPSRPAPPTVPMNITVPEQIQDLLTARGGWMTASEIAAALRIDLQVARTETSALASNGQLSRRTCKGRTTKERYEYSQSTNQRVNESTALSA